MYSYIHTNDFNIPSTISIQMKNFIASASFQIISNETTLYESYMHRPPSHLREVTKRQPSLPVRLLQRNAYTRRTSATKHLISTLVKFYQVQGRQSDYFPVISQLFPGYFPDFDIDLACSKDYNEKVETKRLPHEFSKFVMIHS